ncbi:MAG TPA: hypothetical protein VFN42_04960 [Acetobacteraceae bacterium]|nr:hypothetical protein [Acetobacteraceae bacterium]
MAEQKNEGEGNWTAARAYDRDQKQFAEQGKVDKAAQDAARAVDGPEGEQLREAEQVGKSRAKGEDPALNKRAGGARP